ncbi:MAG: UxaA family hydrolase [Peptococcaceae bacterium]
MKTLILIDEKDNVATVLVDLAEGSEIKIENYNIILKENIPFGHKVALKDIEVNEKVFKYGEPIGSAIKTIQAGSWVHEHNFESIRGLGR